MSMCSGQVEEEEPEIMKGPWGYGGRPEHLGTRKRGCKKEGVMGH